jgi:hypothetical protein
MNHSDTYQLFMDWNFNVIMDMFDNLQTVYIDQGYINNSDSTGFIEMIMKNVNLYHRRGGYKSQKKVTTERTLCDDTERTLCDDTERTLCDDTERTDNKNEDDLI